VSTLSDVLADHARHLDASGLAADDLEAALAAFAASPVVEQLVIELIRTDVYSPVIAAEFSRSGAATVLADLFGFFTNTYLDRHDDGALAGAALHDPLAVLAITHPDLFERNARHVVVETQGEHTAGMTVIDERRLLERSAPNCEVLVDVDADAAFALLVEAIARFSS
jgi:inosine-uridine nucleoside N-ribohydrolase